MLNILISVDSNYLDKAKTMLYSLRMHTKEDVTVYLLNHRLKQEKILSFAGYLKKKCCMTLEVIDVSNTALDGLTIGDLNFTIEMYYRILAQFLLPESVDRVLWIDADTIVLQDISPFYHRDFDNKKYIVCADSQNETSFVKECIQRLKLPKDHTYFNSGVMLMNLDLLRKETSMAHILTVCRKLQDIVLFPDQDILNYLYAGQVKYADWKQYNFQLAGIKTVEKLEEQNIAILHYTGMRKPWNYWQISHVSRHWWHVRFKQGYKWQTIKAYLLRIWDATCRYFKELKDIFF